MAHTATTRTVSWNRRRVGGGKESNTRRAVSQASCSGRFCLLDTLMWFTAMAAQLMPLEPKAGVSLELYPVP